MQRGRLAFWGSARVGSTHLRRAQVDQRLSGYLAHSHQVSELAWKLGRCSLSGARRGLIPLQTWAGFGHWSFPRAVGIWESNDGSSCPFLLLVAGVVSCCQASAQEIPCSTVVALVQPGRGVKGLFALVISLAERLQTGEGEV